MRDPITLEKAKALREILASDMNYMGGGGLHGDDICSFVDTDGVVKSVECIRATPDGPDEWVKVASLF